MGNRWHEYDMQYFAKDHRQICSIDALMSIYCLDYPVVISECLN